MEERSEERAGADVGEEALEGGENEVLLLGGEAEEREEHAGEQRVADHLVQVAGAQQGEDALRERYLRGTAAGARLERLQKQRRVGERHGADLIARLVLDLIGWLDLPGLRIVVRIRVKEERMRSGRDHLTAGQGRGRSGWF